MTPSGPALLVPVTVEAAVITGQVSNGTWTAHGTWSWALPDYTQLSAFGAVDPSPLTQSAPGAPGVVLHWALPDGLTHGQPAAGGALAYPPIPTRWLVVRKAPSGDGTTWEYAAWVVVSDAVGGPSGARYPLQPGQTGTATTLGAAFPLEGWTPAEDTYPSLDPPLTALGPGHPAFAANVPPLGNVLSFTDSLSDVAQGTLSYSVCGWYPDPALDPLAGWETEADLAALLQRLGWAIDADARSAALAWAQAEDVPVDPKAPHTILPARTVCHGVVFGVEWLGPEGPLVSGVPPVSDTEPGWVEPQVAVGNTAIDALVALLASDAGEAELLEALQYDALGLLDRPDHRAQIFERVQAGGFATSAGGTQWVAAGDLDADAAAALAELNEAQRALDAAARDLAALQWQLFADWTLVQEQESDPFEQPHLAAAQAAVDALEPQVQSAASAYRFERGRRDRAVVALDGVALNGVPRPPFQAPADPVVVVSGARRSVKHGADGQFSADGTLACRASGQTVAGIAVDAGGSEPVTVGAGQVPLPDLGSHADLPAEAADLAAEAFFLDPLNAPWIAAQAAPGDPWPLLGTIRTLQTQVWNAALSDQFDAQALASVPSGDGAVTPGLVTRFALGAIPSKVGVEAWAPPWTPLFIAWQVTFYPGTADAPSTLDPALWALAPQASGEPDQDLAYHWAGGMVETSGGGVTLSGRTLLTAQPSDLLAARIEQLIDGGAGDPAVQADLPLLQAALEQVADADLLAQSLSGLHAALLQRQVTTFATTATPGQAIDPALAPYLQPAGAPAFQPPTWPEPAAPALQYAPIRAGHLEIAALWVVDAFGQVFDVLGAMDQALVPVLAPDLVTPAPNPPAMIELKPRIVQPSRLLLDLLDASDDGLEVGVAAGADPVCGWVMANRLDRSLLVYDAAGAYLGELLATGPDGAGSAWLPPPEAGPLPAAGDPVRLGGEGLNAHLAAMVEGVAAASGGVTTMVELVDRAATGRPAAGAWADPELQMMLGRPLALVRARLALELDGPLAPSQAWADLGTANTAGFEQVRFDVQIGSVELADDGVAAYWVNDDYSAAGSAFVAHGSAGPYSTAARPAISSDPLGTALLTLLVDPSLEIHAVSGALPALAATVPQELASPDLASMEATFRVGPILDVPAGAGVTLPLPAIREGAWSWLEYEEPTAAAAAAPVVAAGALPALPDGLPVLRNGHLRLVLAPSPTALTCSVAPGALPAGSIAAALTVSAYNGTGADVTCTGLEVQLAVGTGAGDLTAAAALGTIAASLGGGKDSPAWTIAADATGTFTATPPGGSATVAKGATLAFSLTGIQVNPVPGRTTLAITETVGGHTSTAHVVVTKGAA